MKTLVINADDFGLTDGVSEGIIRCIEEGVLTTTSAMMCVAGSQDRVAAGRKALTGRIGLHLQLTSGQPILDPQKIPSLVRPDGTFPDSRREPMARRADEILLEWHAQMEALLETGVTPTHLDSHHHMHAEAGVFDAFLDFAASCGLPSRALSTSNAAALRSRGVPAADLTVIRWFDGELSSAHLLNVLTEATRGLEDEAFVELMAHPGMVDEQLPFVSKYVHPRLTEMRTLIQPGLREQLAEAGFRLGTFRDLPLSARSTNALEQARR